MPADYFKQLGIAEPPQRGDYFIGFGKYLAEVPQDLFTGRPLVYRRTKQGYVLYSVGANGRDDGGRSADEDPPGDDISVRMPALLATAQRN